MRRTGGRRAQPIPDEVLKARAERGLKILNEWLLRADPPEQIDNDELQRRIKMRMEEQDKTLLQKRKEGAMTPEWRKYEEKRNS